MQSMDLRIGHLDFTPPPATAKRTTENAPSAQFSPSFPREDTAEICGIPAVPPRDALLRLTLRPREPPMTLDRTAAPVRPAERSAVADRNRRRRPRRAAGRRAPRVLASGRPRREPAARAGVAAAPQDQPTTEAPAAPPAGSYAAVPFVLTVTAAPAAPPAPVAVTVASTEATADTPATAAPTGAVAASERVPATPMPARAADETQPVVLAPPARSGTGARAASTHAAQPATPAGPADPAAPAPAEPAAPAPHAEGAPAMPSPQPAA